MELFYKICEYIACFIDGFCGIVFLWLICGKKSEISFKIFIPCTLVYGVLFAFFPIQSDNMLIQVPALVGTALVYELVFLKGKVGKKIYYNIVWNVVLMLTNFIAVYGVVAVFKFENNIMLNPGSMERVFLIIIQKLLLVLCSIAILFYNNRHKLDYKQWIITIIQLVGSLSIGAILLNLYRSNGLDEESGIYLIVVAVILFIMGIGVCVTQHILNVQNNYKLENERLRSFISEEEQNIRRIEELYESSKIIRHDLKHYSVMISNYLKEERYDEIQQFLDSTVEEGLNNSTVYYTSDNTLNAVLNNKLTICKEKHIPIDVKISASIPENKSIDICVILSNLLDNAIRAQQDINKKLITVKIYSQNDMLYLVVSNHIEGSVLRDNPKLETTKDDKVTHGLGLKSIKKRVSDMDGMYKISEKGDSFTTTITIPMENKK
ncbi:MAG: GHKL domain-containing protein [Lachnospiraceae bacterium]|nr:GHKL domain-containing protein [Lachnospiraceae bacterium]